MIQVKIIEETHNTSRDLSLETVINTFLRDKAENITVLTIQYQMSTSQGWGTNKSCMITFEDNK